MIHTDAIQGVSWLDLRARDCRRAPRVDLRRTSSAARRASGALVVRDGVDLVPLIDGGGHEGERRAGTQNVAGHRRAGRGRCVPPTNSGGPTARGSARCAIGSRPASLAAVPGSGRQRRHGAARRRESCNCAFPGTEAETLLVALDQREVYASSGSACASGATDPSHVLLAMGLTPSARVSSVRFSLGHTTTDADIDAALAVIPSAVQRLVGAAA